MVLLTLFAMITLCALPMFFAFIFRDMGKTLDSFNGFIFCYDFFAEQ